MLSVPCNMHLYKFYVFHLSFRIPGLSSFFFNFINMHYTFKGFTGLHFWCLYEIFIFYNKFQLCFFSCSTSNMLSTLPLTSVLDNHWTRAKSCFKAVVTISDVSHKAIRLTHPEENLKATVWVLLGRAEGLLARARFTLALNYPVCS